MGGLTISGVYCEDNNDGLEFFSWVLGLRDWTFVKDIIQLTADGLGIGYIY